MLLVVVSLAVGIVTGLVLGGSLRGIAHVKFRWWPLAFLGLAMQAIPIPGTEDRWLAVSVLVLSYVVLLTFVVVNLRLPGFFLLGLGFALNGVVIALNGGMPVTGEALRSAAGDQADEALQRLVTEGGSKHHLAGPGDVLVPLTDVIPVGPPIRQVLSIGDVLSLAGTSWLIAGMTLGRGAAAGVKGGQASDQAATRPANGVAEVRSGLGQPSGQSVPGARRRPPPQAQ